MNWYVVKILFRIISGSGNHIAQFEEQLRIIQAQNEQQALEKARAIGAGAEDEFLNHKKEKVKWQFVDVSDLAEIKAWENGTEILSRIEEVENSGDYIYEVKQRAMNIERRNKVMAETLS